MCGFVARRLLSLCIWKDKGRMNIWSDDDGVIGGYWKGPAHPFTRVHGIP